MLCPSCKSILTPLGKEYFDTRFGIERSYDIEQCNRCGIETIAPVPSQAELKVLYETYYNFSGEQGNKYGRLRETILFSPLYRLWLLIDGDIAFQARRGTGRLLDIGCNEGRGLRFFRKNGFSAEGLEVNRVAASVARSRGFRVHEQLLDTFEPEEPYDVAVLSNVLEHSIDPKQMLSHAHRVLRPGGEIWISCPNNKSWLRSIFSRYWINWHVPFHIVHFSQNSLASLLHKTGFTIVEIRQETPALWVSHSIISRLYARRGRTTRQLRNPLIVLLLMLIARGALFPLLWAGNSWGRGDCLVVTARKE